MVGGDGIGQSVPIATELGKLASGRLGMMVVMMVVVVAMTMVIIMMMWASQATGRWPHNLVAMATNNCLRQTSPKQNYEESLISHFVALYIWAIGVYAGIFSSIFPPSPFEAIQICHFNCTSPVLSAKTLHFSSASPLCPGTLACQPFAHSSAPYLHCHVFFSTAIYPIVQLNSCFQITPNIASFL